ncbi:hypothetical protein DFJ74DRAFT_666331 [Hyaloraphidium curvatum]|nr:hypothetical protein DFJ74DRAFT_666331 [Hyaloraphidium curvatum]
MPGKPRRRQREPSADSSALAAQLATLGLERRDVAGDGNCLFRALSDQLHGHDGLHARLRADTVRHMRDHAGDYRAFIDPDVDAGLGRKGRRKHTGDPAESGFALYLENMARDGVYAGNLELVAFAKVAGRDVVVHQLGQAPWAIRCEGPKTGPALHIVYRDWEHYESVRSIAGHAGKEGGVEWRDVADPAARRASAEREGRTKWGQPVAWGTDDPDAEAEEVDVSALMSSYGEDSPLEEDVPARRDSLEHSRGLPPLPPPESAPPAGKEKRPSKQQLREAKKRAQKEAALEKKRGRSSTNASDASAFAPTGRGDADGIEELVGGMKVVCI